MKSFLHQNNISPVDTYIEKVQNFEGEEKLHYIKGVLKEIMKYSLPDAIEFLEDLFSQKNIKKEDCENLCVLFIEALNIREVYIKNKGFIHVLFGVLKIRNKNNKTEKWERIKNIIDFIQTSFYTEVNNLEMDDEEQQRILKEDLQNIQEFYAQKIKERVLHVPDDKELLLHEGEMLALQYLERQNLENDTYYCSQSLREYIFRNISTYGNDSKFNLSYFLTNTPNS